MRKGILVFLLAISVFGSARPVGAEPPNCLANFAECMFGSAGQSNFWWRTVSALDCELNLWGCLKQTLLF